MAQRVFQLCGTCNNYPWGKKGHNSLAAKLCKNTDKAFQIKDDEAYSEMWFGDYPDFPARLVETGELLKDVLDKDKETLLGKEVIDRLGGQLPFLPKILSIAKALPLQIHPNKALAAKLHAKDPKNFTDPNHKPEIAVALSRFELFAGFKPLPEIEPLFTGLPCLRPFVPSSASSDWTEATLRSVVRALLKAPELTVRSVSDALLAAPQSAFGPASSPHIPDLLPRLRAQYGPDDPGALVALLCMNYMVLAPGEALYIPADGIHAYLAGDIVECMARSNNVLNAGFCPPADRNSADLFADAMTFAAHSRRDMLLPAAEYERVRAGRTWAGGGTGPEGGRGKGKVRVYRPPMREFDMLRVDLERGEEVEVEGSEGPGVMIVTKGEGTMEADGKRFGLGEGAIFFVAPGVGVKWATEKGIEVYMAVV